MNNNNGIKLIVGVLKSSTLEESWHILINNIVNELKEKYYDKYISSNDENKLERLIILDIVGPEIIKRWFNNNDEVYKPEFLREPYVLTSVRNDITLKMKNELILIFDDILSNLDNKEYVITFKNDIKRVFNELQNHITTQYDDKSIIELYDDIGTSLICLLKNHDVLSSMISTELDIVNNNSNNYINISKENDKEKNQNDVDLDEIEQLLDSYTPEDMNEICKKVLGTLLPESMRTIIWSYRYLYRSLTDTPVGLIYVRELSRLANLRKISITINDDMESPTNNVIGNCVHSGIINSFGTSIYLNQNKKVENNNIGDISKNLKEATSPWFGKLERRSTVLVYAAYILNGTLNDRITMSCIMLMYSFPNEPPTSEKMLRLMKRIVGECLPSEHLNKNYSLATTSSEVWILLQQKDRELYDHLQDSEISIDEFISKSETPRSLQLLSNWLENCFIGYLPEHTVLLIWDQLALLGGSPTVYQKFLPQMCCLLLTLLRNDLLKTQSDLKTQLFISGKKLKTSTVANEMRDKILMSWY